MIDYKKHEINLHVHLCKTLKCEMAVMKLMKVVVVLVLVVF